jgi:hypothetical protein
MATKTIELTGTLEWAKLFEFNRDQGEFDVETDGATSVNLLMDEATFKKMKDAGVRKQGKKDDETGQIRVNFKRAWVDKFGRDWAAGPPKVFTPAGTDYDPQEMGLIGNGSTGTVFVDVYDTKMGKGSRLNAVQVIDHIAFESPDGDDSGGSSYSVKPKDYTGGEAPKATSTPKAKPKFPKIEEDDCPF